MPALISQPTRITGTVALVLSVLAILLAVSVNNTQCASAASGSCPVGDTETFASGITINTDLTTNDTVISGDTAASLFFADSSTDRIGIGTNTPTELLDVAGNVAITAGGTLTLATDLAVTDGGTGVGTFTDAGVLIGNGTGNVAVTTAGTTGQLLTSNGPGVDPTFQTPAGGGINQWDQWRLTTGYTAGTGYTYLTTNLESNDSSSFSVLGSGMTELTGLFTFPGTGYWSVYFQMNTNTTYGGHVTENIYIWYTDDNWASQSVSTQSSGYGYYSEGTALTASGMFHITDTVNQQVKFGRYSPHTTSVYGSSNENITYMNFIRIAE